VFKQPPALFLSSESTEVERHSIILLIMALSSAAFNNKVELTAVTSTPHEHIELKWNVQNFKALLERALVKGTTVASLPFKLVKSKIG